MLLLPYAEAFGEAPAVAPSWGLASARHRERHPEELCVITCANGHRTRMVRPTHYVLPNGIVIPSYVCTHPGCTWRVFVRLDGWKEYGPQGP